MTGSVQNEMFYGMPYVRPYMPWMRDSFTNSFQLMKRLIKEGPVLCLGNTFWGNIKLFAVVAAFEKQGVPSVFYRRAQFRHLKGEYRMVWSRDVKSRSYEEFHKRKIQMMLKNGCKSLAISSVALLHHLFLSDESEIRKIEKSLVDYIYSLGTLYKRRGREFDSQKAIRDIFKMTIIVVGSYCGGRLKAQYLERKWRDNLRYGLKESEKSEQASDVRSFNKRWEDIEKWRRDPANDPSTQALWRGLAIEFFSAIEP